MNSGETPKQAALCALEALAREPFEGLAGLPSDDAPLLARELWRFLVVKKSANVAVSPGPRVDALWHAMLLETDVADVVHAALGGPVPHSLRNSLRLTDEEKIGRRVAALGLYERRHGWAPVTRFWEERGTIGARLVRVDEDGSGRGVTYEARAAGVEEVCPPAPAPAAATPPNKRARDGEAPALPPPSVTEARLDGAGQEQPLGGDGGGGGGDGGIVNFFVDWFAENKQYAFRARSSTKVGSILAALARERGIDRRRMCLVFDGRRLFESETLGSLGVREGEVVDLVREQVGC